MAKASIALTELAEKGPDIDLVRDMLQLAAQKLMEMDVEALCGAAYGERSIPRENSRNGFRDRPWETRAGAIDLRIPKLRKGSYFPGFPGASSHGRKGADGGHPGSVRSRISTRSVDELVKALGMTGISKSQVSRLCSRDRRTSASVLQPADRGRLAVSLDRRDLCESARFRPHRFGGRYTGRGR